MQFEANCILSVILPVFNAEKYVGKAIDSILNQTFSDFELLISDDGSKDGSRKVIEHYKKEDDRIILSHNESNQGKVATVNRLFKMARGKFITVHDADDWSHLERFRKQIDFLSSNHNIGFCGTNFIMSSISFSKKSNLVTGSNQLKSYLLQEPQMHGPTIIFRRDCIKNEIYRPFFDGYGEDYDLVLRLLDNCNPANLNECLYNYNIVKGSLSNRLTPRKMFMHEIARALSKQRIERGKDQLMEGKKKLVEKYVKKLIREYEIDKSLIHVKQAERNLFFGFKQDAIIESLLAIKKNPWKLSNYRLLQHCIRKIVIGH